MEGDVPGIGGSMLVSISTHALTWRATLVVISHLLRDCISTHALTWRATQTRGNVDTTHVDFYPRPHMEGDIDDPDAEDELVKFLPTPSHGGRPSAAGWEVQGLHISTHALTWRATTFSLLL